MEMIKYAVAQNVTEINEILLGIDDNAAETVTALLRYLFQGFIDVVRHARTELSSSLDDLATAAEMLDEDLQEYIEHGQMDDDFYMYGTRHNSCAINLHHNRSDYALISRTLILNRLHRNYVCIGAVVCTYSDASPL